MVREMETYEELEGKIIDWTSKDYYNGKIFKVKVAAIDPDIGLTLVNAEDENEYFSCVHGPSSKRGKIIINKNQDRYNNWNQHFAALIKMIKDGLWDVSVDLSFDLSFDGRGHSCGTQPTAANCPFGT